MYMYLLVHLPPSQIKEIPGVVIFRFQGPVCYINSKVFVARLRMACKLERSNALEEPGCLKVLFHRVSVCVILSVTYPGILQISAKEFLIFSFLCNCLMVRQTFIKGSSYSFKCLGNVHCFCVCHLVK